MSFLSRRKYLVLCMTLVTAMLLSSFSGYAAMGSLASRVLITLALLAVFLAVFRGTPERGVALLTAVAALIVTWAHHVAPPSGLVVADDLIDELLAAFLVLDLDGGAEDATPVRLEPLRIDHLGVGELHLDLGNAAFDEALPLLRGIVLRVLREVPVRARFGDRGDRFRPGHRLQLVQFGAQFLGARDGKGSLPHAGE